MPIFRIFLFLEKKSPLSLTRQSFFFIESESFFKNPLGLGVTSELENRYLFLKSSFPLFFLKAHRFCLGTNLFCLSNISGCLKSSRKVVLCCVYANLECLDSNWREKSSWHHCRDEGGRNRRQNSRLYLPHTNRTMPWKPIFKQSGFFLPPSCHLFV